MTIEEIYQLAIQLGIGADPRGKTGVEKTLKRRKEQFEKLSKRDQALFDLESLTNPYADSRVVFGDRSVPVNKVLVGIDIYVGEMLLADRLNQKGEGIDLVIAHHPMGLGLAGLHEVMDVQIEMMASYGVPINIAEALLTKRIGEVERGISPINHNQPVDAARLLGIPLMNVHTPSDNLVHEFLTKFLAKKELERVGDIIDALLEIQEYQEAAKGKAGPAIQVGSPENRAGNVVAAEITGGTEGAHEIYEKLAHAGVGTIVSMHASEKHYEETKKHHLNRVIAGHISSDSLGMNLFLDQLEKKGIEIIPCSGLIRVSRNRSVSAEEFSRRPPAAQLKLHR